MTFVFCFCACAEQGDKRAFSITLMRNSEQEAQSYNQATSKFEQQYQLNSLATRLINPTLKPG